MIEKLQNVDFKTLLKESLNDNKEALKEYQQEQMLEGKSKIGKIGKYRSKSYAGRKYAINPKAGLGNVDLKLTGSFQSKIVIKVKNDSVAFDSTDEKAKKLIKKYGKNVFGLNKENSENYSWQVIGPSIIKKFKKKVL